MARWPVCRKCKQPLMLDEIAEGQGLCVNCRNRKEVSMLSNVLRVATIIFVAAVVAVVMFHNTAFGQEVSEHNEEEYGFRVEWNDSTTITTAVNSNPEQSVEVTVYSAQPPRTETQFATRNGHTTTYARDVQDEPRGFMFEETLRTTMTGTHWQKDMCNVGPVVEVKRFASGTTTARVENTTGETLHVTDHVSGWVEIAEGDEYFYSSSRSAETLTIKTQPVNDNEELLECAALWWNWEPYGPPVEVVVGNAIATIDNPYVEVPIRVSDISDRDILSYQFSVTVDAPSIVQPVYVRTDNTLSSAFNTDYHQISPATLAVAAYGTQNLTGEGILAWIGFQVSGIPGQVSVEVHNFMFNEGAPSSNTSTAVIEIKPLYVSGSTTYLHRGVPVPGVEMQLIGPSMITGTTSHLGGFALPVPFIGHSWELTLIKYGDVCNSITPYDAYLIARCVVDPETQICNQAASDVTHDGRITGLDAAEVAKYSVGLPAVPGVGLWQATNPASYSFEPLVTSEEVHFVLSLGGDVSGNYAFCQAQSTTSVPQANVQVSVNSSTVNLTISTGQPVGALRLDLDFGESAQLTGVTSTVFSNVFQNGSVIGLYGEHEVNEAHVQLEFQVNSDTEVRLSSLLINETQYVSDVVIPLPEVCTTDTSCEPPATMKRLFMPIVE